MTWVRRTEIAIIGILVVLVAAVLILPGMINWNDYRKDIAESLESFVGQPVVLAGNLDFQILPAPALNVGGIAIGDVLEVEELEVRLSILPLLYGRIEFASIILNEPSLDLREDEGGAMNWQLPEEDTAATVDAQRGDDGFEVAVSNLAVRRGSLRFRSERTDTDLSVSQVNLEIAADAANGPFHLEGWFDYEGEEVEIEVQSGAIDTAAIPVSAGVTLPDRGASWKLDGVIKDQGQHLTFDGKVHLTGEDLGAVLEAMAVTDGASSERLAFSVRGDIAASEVAINLTALEVELNGNRIAGNVSVATDATMNIDAQLRAASLNINSILALLLDSEEAPIDLSLPALPESIAGTLDITVDALSFGETVMQDVALAGQLRSGELIITAAHASLPGASDASLSGRYSNSGEGGKFDGEVAFSAADMRRLLEATGTDVAAFEGAQPFQADVRGNITLDSGNATLRLTDATIARTPLTGSIEYASRGAPSLNLDLNLGRLNVDALSPQSSSGAVSAGSNSEPATIPWPQTFATNVRLHASELIFQGLSYKDVFLSASAEGGKATIRKASVGDIDGAAVSLSGELSEGADGLYSDVEVTVSARRKGALAGLVPSASEFLTGLPKVEARTSVNGEVGNLHMAGSVRAGQSALLFDGSVKDMLTAPEFTAEYSGTSAAPASLLADLGLGASDPGLGRLQPISFGGHVAGSAAEADASFAIEMAAAAISGSVTIEMPDAGVSSFSGQMNVMSQNTGVAFDGLLPGLDVFGSAPVATDLALEFSARGGIFNLSSLSGTFADAAINGKATLDRSGQVGLFDAELKAGAFASGLFQHAPETIGIAPTEPFRWSSEILDLSWLQNYQGKLGVEVEEIHFYGYDLKNLVIGIELADGVATTTVFRGALFDGAFDGTLALDGNSTPEITATLNVIETDLDRALMALAELDVLTGRASASASLHTRGWSEQAMISALAGNIDVEAGGGVIKGIDVPALSARLEQFAERGGGTAGGRGLGAVLLTAAFDTVGMIGSALGGGDTAYEPFSVPMAVLRGNINMPLTEVNVDGGTLRASGDIDLPRWQSDLVADLSLNSFQDAPSVGIDVRGPVDDPEVIQRTSSLGNYMIGRVTREVQGSGVDGEESESQPQPPVEQSPAAGLGGALIDEFFNRIRSGQGSRTAP